MILLLLSDLGALAIATFVVKYFYKIYCPMPQQWGWWIWLAKPSLFIAFASATLLLFAYKGLYSSSSKSENYIKVAGLTSFSYISSLIIGFLWQTGIEIPRAPFFIAWVTSISLITGFRVVINHFWHNTVSIKSVSIKSTSKSRSWRKVIGTRVDSTSYEDACKKISTWARENRSCYIVAANVHVVMTGFWERAYQKIINHAALVTPDGMPLAWALKLLGKKDQTRVYGPDLMLAWCDRAAQLGLPIYLYGGTESTLAKLKSNLEKQFPQLIIAGTHSPPFRAPTPAEEQKDIEEIHASGAKVVFVGLGCPKQEKWMARMEGRLQAVMIGVGAAFSFHSGEVSQAPRWMMKLGLEWLYRLTKEPGRLWKRYVINNPAFVILFALQLLRTWTGIDGNSHS